MKNSLPIICIGSTSQDIFFPIDEGVIIETPEDLTSKVKIAFELGGKYRVADRYEAVGGVAANVSQGLSKLGQKVACYSKVGNDTLGQWISGELKKANVAINSLFIDESVRTDLSAIIVLTQNGERTIFHNRDANEKLEILEEKLLPASWFFVSALNGPWQENLKKILSLKRKGEVRLAFNPGQHNIKENASLIRETMKEADLVVLNKDEALELLLAGKSIPPDFQQEEKFLIRELSQGGKGIVALTDGARGAWASDGKEFWHGESHLEGSVKDATGAGDAFTSAFFGSVIENIPLPEALKRGITNSLSVLQAYGAGSGLLDSRALAEKSTSVKLTRLS